MKVRELIELLQKEKQDVEVRFSETFVSTARAGERHSCGPEDGSRIFGVTTETNLYADGVWEDRVILEGEVLADVPGPHFPPFEDDEGTQKMVKEVPDRSDDDVAMAIKGLVNG